MLEAEQLEEWYALERQALEQLRAGNVARGTGVRQVFQLLVLPSYEAARSWEVCQDVKAENRCFAIRSVWHRRTDLSKLDTPVVRLRYSRPLAPTIEVRQWPLEIGWVEATRAKLKNLLIPAMVESGVIGCDGTCYEVVFDAGFEKARYHWWEEPPPGWSPLNQWLQETLQALERYGPVEWDQA